MAKIISGKDLSVKLKAEMAEQVKTFPEKYGRVPHLVVILVGEDPASQSYVKGKAKASEVVGIKNTTILKPADISEAELLGLIDQLNADDTVDGILVQLPLPDHISEDKVIAPILVATNYSNRSTSIQMSVYDDRVINPLVTGKAGISALIENVLEEFPNEAPVHNDWVISPYAPTPTIVEAAKTLYESHSVENITRHEADKVSTDATIKYILDVI